MRNISILLAALVLAGCNSIENRYVDATGVHGHGVTTFSATQTDGKFTISDDGSTCSGSFPHWKSATVVFHVSCSDGKSGTVTMTRPTANATMVAGEGTVQFTDGTTRRFIFGRKDML